MCFYAKWNFKFILKTDLVYTASYKNNQNVKFLKYDVKIECFIATA